MAASYDELEPWYEHLYARLHDLATRELAPSPGGDSPAALDAGCGTGFPTSVLLGLGYRTAGIDLSAGLLAIARRRYPAACIVRGDIEALPWRDASFDLVASCGSTLSFVECPERAFGEIGRVLRPGGRALLEVEHRFSLDLLWRLASSVLGDPLRYGATPAEAVAAWARPLDASIVMDYPGYPALRLFARRDLDRRLAAAGLVVVRAWGLHSVTNLIPSTVLHRPHLGRVTAAVYRRLCVLDRALAPTRAGRWLANSLIVLAIKPPRGPRDDDAGDPSSRSGKNCAQVGHRHPLSPEGRGPG